MPLTQAQKQHVNECTVQNGKTVIIEDKEAETIIKMPKRRSKLLFDKESPQISKSNKN